MLLFNTLLLLVWELSLLRSVILIHSSLTIAIDCVNFIIKNMEELQEKKNSAIFCNFEVRNRS